jgi:hypothetical protein
MPTAGHFNHRFVDNYFEAAQGVVVRVSFIPKKRRGGGRYSVSNDKKKEKLCFLTWRCPFSKPSPTFRPSTCRGAKQTHGLNALKRLVGEKRGPPHLDVLGLDNNSTRRHYLHAYFEGLFPVRRMRGLQTSVARVAYVTQESRIARD